MEPAETLKIDIFRCRGKIIQPHLKRFMRVEAGSDWTSYWRSLGRRVPRSDWVVPLVRRLLWPEVNTPAGPALGLAWCPEGHQSQRAAGERRNDPKPQPEGNTENPFSWNHPEAGFNNWVWKDPHPGIKDDLGYNLPQGWWRFQQKLIYRYCSSPVNPVWNSFSSKTDKFLYFPENLICILSFVHFAPTESADPLLASDINRPCWTSSSFGLSWQEEHFYSCRYSCFSEFDHEAPDHKMWANGLRSGRWRHIFPR